MFLLRVGLVTHVDGFIDGSNKAVSLPTYHIESSTDVLRPFLDWWSYIGEGAFRYSLNLSTKVLADFPNVFLIAV